MTICNMSIEAGARAGMVAPDDTTFAYVDGRPHAPTAPTGSGRSTTGVRSPTDDGATFDAEVTIDAPRLQPYVTWGTNPAQSVTIDDVGPSDPRRDNGGRSARSPTWRSEPGTPIRDIRPDTIFIGSCTNSRIEDLRAGRRRRPRSHGGGGAPRAGRPRLRRREAPGRAGGPRPDVFVDAGFDWRGAGCSMCLGMNPDILQPGDRSASTSNRNFEGRQGKGGRTHLVSPRVAAATAIAGHFTTPEDL